MKLEHFGMAEPGACRLVFTADAAELDAALRAVQATRLSVRPGSADFLQAAAAPPGGG